MFFEKWDSNSGRKCWAISQVSYITMDRGRRLILSKSSTLTCNIQTLPSTWFYDRLTITSITVRGFLEEYKFYLYTMHWINIEKIIVQNLSNSGFVLYMTPLFRTVLNHSGFTFEKLLWLRGVPHDNTSIVASLSFKGFSILLTVKITFQTW